MKDNFEKIQKSGCDLGVQMLLNAVSHGSPEQRTNQLLITEIACLHFLANMSANHVRNGNFQDIEKVIENWVNHLIPSGVDILEKIDEGKTKFIDFNVGSETVQ